MLPPWAPSPSPRNPPPQFFGRRSSPRHRGGFGSRWITRQAFDSGERQRDNFQFPTSRYYPDYPPYGYPHPSYSYPPYSSGPGWGLPPHMPIWDHYGVSPRQWSRRPRRGRNSYGGQSPRRYGNGTVVVTNLADDINENKLREIFSELSVDSCKVMRNRGKNLKAFVNFSNHKKRLWKHASSMGRLSAEKR
eukprot:TRINITY_DN1697_c0_g1_i2.p1 TRINITY_DN1697_c0_g1~~TRINITY_DN1697_c0_g1_i2.p1  ORF type:complete len:191 (-),score=3.32 TRINITY_DN1697_c0_g1_i2:743-1315(-)